MGASFRGAEVYGAEALTRFSGTFEEKVPELTLLFWATFPDVTAVLILISWQVLLKYKMYIYVPPSLSEALCQQK